MNDAVRPSPHDTLFVHNPLKQSFTIEYEDRPWTIAAGDTVSHPFDLAVHFAGEMATAVINEMGNQARARIEKAQPQISLQDLHRELLKREIRTNDKNVRKKLMSKIIKGVDKLYPMEAQRPLDPKRESTVTASTPYYSMDEQIVIEILKDDYRQLAGQLAGKQPTETTERITTDIGMFEEVEAPPQEATTPSQPSEEVKGKPQPKKAGKQGKKDDDLFKEVMS